MRKLFLSALFASLILLQANAQQKTFDQPVQLKSCNISITANPFVAKTFIELEFYNPSDQEVEGYQTFQLNRGQVVTAFQLDLNGKYREGSIEERWKATRAYSSIVGKRMDPAILSMDYNNNYNLHIYPITAHGSRKVTMTITQLMKEDSAKLTYDLPLNFANYTASFHLKINVNNTVTQPVANKGLLLGQDFELQPNGATFDWQTNNIQLNKPVSFSIPLQENKPQLCISKENGQTNFVLRFFPGVPRFYAVQPKAISVFWDVSKSSASRNIEKELDFLERYIVYNGIGKTTITLFNQQIQQTLIYISGKEKFSPYRNYLLNYHYSGATVLGNLDFAAPESDAILLFSDGLNTFGKSLPTPGATQVSCIVSGASYNEAHLQKIIGNNGGTVIHLDKLTATEAVKKISTAENFLVRYNSPSGGVHINESFPLKLGAGIQLTGTIAQSESLQLMFGNNNAVNKIEPIYLNANDNCEKDLYKTISMLKAYDSVMYTYSNYYWWQNMVVFGLNEKVVTPQTSFLVLEKIEDYIKYNIAPPKELEEKCAEMNYVYKSDFKIRALRTFTEQETLQSVVTNYNQRIRWWDKNAAPIDLTKPFAVAVNENDGKGKQPGTAASNSIVLTKTINSAESTVFNNNNNALSEVVVTAMGIKRQAREIGYSSARISTEELTQAKVTNVATGLAAKVSGLQVSLVNNGVVPQTRITLRGNRSILGNNQALLVVDDIQLPMNYISTLNPNDVENVTVLKGASASALYGSEASNGVVIVTTKKGSRNGGYPTWKKYKLSDVVDVDYMQEIQKVSSLELWDTYTDLEKENGNYAGFYFDMADYFFTRGQHGNAKTILYNAAELCKGKSAGLKAVAYTLESWKDFDEAISIYKNILADNKNDLPTKKDLALAYFQQGRFQQAVNEYYSIITWQSENNYSYGYGSIKQMALSEMNAVIALHFGSVDLSGINLRLVKTLPVDLRITTEGNYGSYYYNQVQIEEPKGEICTHSNPDTKWGGHFTQNQYDYYYNDKTEYSVKNAVNGKYKVVVNAYDYGYYKDKIPQFIRVITFKNFQRPNQTMEVKNYILDNQYGQVEVDEIKW